MTADCAYPKLLFEAQALSVLGVFIYKNDNFTEMERYLM